MLGLEHWNYPQLSLTRTLNSVGYYPHYPDIRTLHEQSERACAKVIAYKHITRHAQSKTLVCLVVKFVVQLVHDLTEIATFGAGPVAPTISV